MIDNWGSEVARHRLKEPSCEKMMNSTPIFVLVQTTYLSPPRNSSTGRSEPELVAFLEKYYSLFLLIVGTVGNLLCLAVLSRETFRRSSAGIYLRFLTVSDLTAIYTGVLFFTARALFNNNFRKIDELSCKFHRWLSFTACDLSSWALVLVSTARLLSIAWPMKRLITRRRVYASIFLTIVILLGANLPIFIIYGDVRDPIKNRTSLCVFTQESYEDFYIYVFSWLVLVKFGFLPGVLLIVLNAALVLTVSRSGRAVDQVTSRKSHPESSPVGRNVKTKISVRKEKMGTDYSSKSAVDFESLELSTGSEVSDGTFSSSDRSEVTATKVVNGHLVSAWSKILLRLKLKRSHEPPGYRLKESGLRNLFCGIRMMWQGDELESQKDLVSLNEDVSNWSLTKQTSIEEKKQSSILSKETNFSWLDKGEKSDPENVCDLAGAKIPCQQYGLPEIPEVQKTYTFFNNGSNSHVDFPYPASSPTGGSASVRVGREFSTDQTISNDQDCRPSSSIASCNNHIRNSDENIQLQPHVNTTFQPAKKLDSKLSSNNIRTLSEGQLCLNYINQTRTCQCGSDNCFGNNFDVGLGSMLEFNISDDFTTKKDTEKHGKRGGDLASIDPINYTNQETWASFRDRHCTNESETNTEHSSTKHHIDMNINNEVPSICACVNVNNKSSDSCSQSYSLNSSDVDHTQRHTHPTCRHRLCECSLSEKSSSPRDIRKSKNINPASLGGAPCGDFPVENTESTINTDSAERTLPESILALSCTSLNDTTGIRSKDTVSQVEKLTESPAVSHVEKLTESPAVSQAENLTQSPAVSQVEKLTKQHLVSQVGDFTEAPAVRRRRGYRRKPAVQSKVINKSRSLTRTLLVLNTVFLLCNTPITVYLTGKAYFWPDAVEYSDVQEIIVTVANFSMYTSNSINFILYCVTGSRFRGQLVLMFKDLYRFVGNCTRRLSQLYKQRS